MYLILCPLKNELDHLLKAFEQKGFSYENKKNGLLNIYSFKELNLICAQGGHGKAQFAVQAQFLIQSISDIDSVFCVGVAGGLSSKVKTFDVVIGTKTIEHDYQLKFISQKQPEFLGSPHELQAFKNIQETLIDKNLDWKIHFSTIASGDEDIVESKRATQVFNQTQADAVAWEGAGAGRACRFNNIPFLEIRGISDMANEQTTINFKENLGQAMNNVAEVLFLYFLDKK